MSYKDLKSYQGAVIIYDFTIEFVKRFHSYWSNWSYRTSDQMIQAARSGKQNIVEASNEKVSKKAEIKLLGVARASLQELLEDYEDFLRQNKLKTWDKNSKEAKEVRRLVYKSNWSYQSYQSYLDNPERVANAMICLINQVNYLLDRQIEVLKEKFLNEGGWSEKMYYERLKRRKSNRSY